MASGREDLTVQDTVAAPVAFTCTSAVTARRRTSWSTLAAGSPGSAPPTALPVDEQNILGAIAAACFGVAQAFKIASQGQRLRSGVFDLFSLSWTDTITPRAWEPMSLGRALLVGVGSVGSAAVYVLHLAQAILELTALDRDAVGIENLNRSAKNESPSTASDFSFRKRPRITVAWRHRRPKPRSIQLQGSGLRKLPVVRQQLGEPGDGMGGDARQYILKPSVGIDSHALTRRHEASQHRRSVAAPPTAPPERTAAAPAVAPRVD